MAIANRIDLERAPAQLAASLSRRVGGAADVEVSDVNVAHTSGMSNETVMFTATVGGEHRRLVARVSPADGGIYSRYDLAREQRLMTALAQGTDLPVPEPLFVEDDPTVLGAPFLVMPYVAGESPADDPPFTVAGWLAELPAEARARVNDNALAQLVALHVVDWQALGLHELAPAGASALAERLEADRTWYDWARAGVAHPVVEQAFRWLRANRPPDPERLVLNWGDARLSNMIFASDLSVAAIVDWEMATVGAPERDLGWWLFATRHHTDGIGAPLPDGFPDAAALIARYEELSGHRVEHLDYYEVLGGLEAALIMLRVGSQMITADLLPPASTMGVINPASLLLADLLGIPRPEGESLSFIGNRG